MRRIARLQTVAVLAAGALLGYLAASDKLNPFPSARAAPGTGEAAQVRELARPGSGSGPTACSEGVNKGTFLALAVPKAGGTAESAQVSGKKPNILVIFGDDIGQSNVSAYTHGLMGYHTPNIDRIAREGMLFTDYYAEQSCTAGRSSFITGQCTFRTGLSKVGIPAAPVGLQARDATIAQPLKPLGYATGQFGKNHLGDKNEYLPTVHGFDEFFGNADLGRAVHPAPRSQVVRPSGRSLRAC